MRLFHVERMTHYPMNTGLLAAIVLLCACFSCATMRDRDTIPDYVIEEKGKQIIGTQPLHAFIFEDTRQDMSFQGFLVQKFRKDSRNEKVFKVTISNSEFTVLLYDNMEFDKYFRTSNYIPTTTVTASETNASKPRFVAVSMVDANNQDCLSTRSLWYPTATHYLKTLKDEYLAL